MEPLHSTKFGKELTRLKYETFKAKRGNGRIGIGLKQSPATTRLLGTQRRCKKSVDVFARTRMRSKRCETVPELKELTQ